MIAVWRQVGLGLLIVVAFVVLAAVALLIVQGLLWLEDWIGRGKR